MPNNREEYEIPKSWPPRDIVQWLSATLNEPGVKSIDIRRERSGKYIVWVKHS